MSSAVPEGWKLEPLSALADYHNGRAFKPEDWSKEGLPILRIAQINDPFRETDFYKGSDILDKHLIKKGDLVFSWSATLKAILWGHYDAILNQHIFKVIEKPNVSRAFLQQLLDHSIEKLAESSHGSTMKHIKKGVLDEFHRPIPPLPEQKKIASILTSVDEVIETTQKQIDKLQDLKKATMNELLTKGIGHTEFKDSELGRIPKSWGINQLGDYVKCQGGNAFPSSEFGKIGIPVVRISNIKNGLVDLSGCVHFSESEQFERFIVFEGEILLAMSGATTGKIGVYKAKSPAYLNQRVGRFRIEDKKNVDSAFLNHLVQSEIFADATLRDAIGGAQPNISSSQVESVIYAFPTLSEQKVIASILNSVDHKIDVQNAKLNQTQSLKKSLMQDLLTGKVRVQVN